MPMPMPQGGEDEKKFMSRCMGDAHMNEKFPDSAQKSAVCYKQFRGGNVTKNKTTINKYTIRKETLNGKPYLVVPVVLLTEGVHNGSDGAIYYPYEELKKYPESWNGRYIPVDHPEKEGASISANSPDAIEKWTIGQIFNCKIDETRKALVAEAWIDEQKTKSIAKNVLDILNAGTPLEVSTGLSFDAIVKDGEWNKEKYTKVATNIQPDHLAVLPGKVGACSWVDGCGIRNKEMTIHGGEGSGNFGHSGRPSEVGGSGESGGITKSVYGQVKGRSFSLTPPSPKNPLQDSLEKELGISSQKNGYSVWLAPWNGEPSINKIFATKKEAEKFLKGFGDIKLNKVSTNLDEISHRNLKNKIEDLIIPQNSLVQGADIFLESVFDTYFIWSKRQNGEEKLYKQEYSVTSEGNISLQGDGQEVIEQVLYNPVNNKKGGEKRMNKKEDIDFILNVKQMEMTEADREYITTLEEKKFAGLKAYAEKFAGCKSCNGVEEKKEPVKPPTFNELLQSADPEVREMVLNGVEMAKKKKADLIGAIKANKKNTFTDVVLNSKPVAELEAIVALMGVEVDYSFQAGSVGGSVKTNERQTDGRGVPDAPAINWGKK